MGRHKKVGRPKGKTKTRTAKTVTGCRKTAIFHKVKGAIRKVKGYEKKSCLQ